MTYLSVSEILWCHDDESSTSPSTGRPDTHHFSPVCSPVRPHNKFSQWRISLLQFYSRPIRGAAHFTTMPFNLSGELPTYRFPALRGSCRAASSHPMQESTRQHQTTSDSTEDPAQKNRLFRKQTSASHPRYGPLQPLSMLRRRPYAPDELDLPPRPSFPPSFGEDGLQLHSEQRSGSSSPNPSSLVKPALQSDMTLTSPPALPSGMPSGIASVKSPTVQAFLSFQLGGETYGDTPSTITTSNAAYLKRRLNYLASTDSGKIKAWEDHCRNHPEAASSLAHDHLRSCSLVLMGAAGHETCHALLLLSSYHGLVDELAKCANGGKQLE